MESDDVVILGGSACSSQEPSQGDDSVGDPPEVEPAAGPSRRPRVARVGPQHGSFAAWLVCDSKMPNPLRLPVHFMVPVMPSRRCIAGVCSSSWEYKENAADCRDTFRSLASSGKLSYTFAGHIHGFIEYRINEAWHLKDLFVLDGSLDLHSGLAGARLRDIVSRSGVELDGTNAVEFLEQSPHDVSTPFVVSPVILGRIFTDELPIVASSCRITSRTSWKGRVSGHPSLSVIRSWFRTKEGGDDDSIANAIATQYDNVLLQLPAGAKGLTDEVTAAAASSTAHGAVPAGADPIKMVDVQLCTIFEVHEGVDAST